MKVQCSKCGGDTDTGFTCVKCGHSMQPHTGGIQATDTQQLKAEIAALSDEVFQMSLLHPSEQSFCDIVDRMRQLSAV